MFPYPSGSGLHVGHVIGYTATDILVLDVNGDGKFEMNMQSYTLEGFTFLKDVVILAGDVWNLEEQVYASRNHAAQFLVLRDR